MPQTWLDVISKKITTRSAIAIALTAFVGFVIYYVLVNPINSENQIILLVLGILSTNFTTVVIFYFRKAQSKESKE